MKLRPSDLSESEIRERLCGACRVAFNDLDSLGFPEVSYIDGGTKYWTFEPVAMWMNSRMRLVSMTSPLRITSADVAAIVQLAFWMKGVPDITHFEAHHLALSAMVDNAMKDVFGYGMREAVSLVGDEG